MPGTRIAKDAHVEAGSCVTGEKKVKAGTRWAGSPAQRVGRATHRFPEEAPPRRRRWVAGFAITSLALDALPFLAIFAGVVADLFLTSWVAPAGSSTGTIIALAIAFAAPSGLIIFATYALLTWLAVRVLSLRMKPGVWPVRSAMGWRVWTVGRLMDAARTHLFPMYAAQLTLYGSVLWAPRLAATPKSPRPSCCLNSPMSAKALSWQTTRWSVATRWAAEVGCLSTHYGG